MLPSSPEPGSCTRTERRGWTAESSLEHLQGSRCQTLEEYIVFDVTQLFEALPQLGFCRTEGYRAVYIDIENERHLVGCDRSGVASSAPRLLFEQLAEEAAELFTAARRGAARTAAGRAAARRAFVLTAAHVVKAHFAHRIEVARVQLGRLLEVLQRLGELLRALVEHAAVEVGALAVRIHLETAIEDERLLDRLLAAQPFGALRVELRGWRNGASDTVVLGAMDRPAVAGGAVAALAVVMAASGTLARHGVAGLAEQVEPLPFLTELARRGVRAATFEGADATATVT